jgi:hypothetical protein
MSHVRELQGASVVSMLVHLRQGCQLAPHLVRIPRNPDNSDALREMQPPRGATFETQSPRREKSGM